MSIFDFLKKETKQASRTIGGFVKNATPVGQAYNAYKGFQQAPRQFQQVKQQTQNYFKPTDQVRTRDVVREFPRVIAKSPFNPVNSPKTALDATRFLAKYPAQGAVKVMADPNLSKLAGPLGILANKNFKPESRDVAITPRTKVDKFVFGNDPVPTFQGQAKGDDKFFQEKGAGKFSKPLGYGVAGASLAMDLFPGGKNAASKALSKASTLKSVSNIANKLGITDPNTLKKLVKETDVNKIGKIINGAKKTSQKIGLPLQPKQVGKSKQLLKTDISSSDRLSQTAKSSEGLDATKGLKESLPTNQVRSGVEQSLNSAKLSPSGSIIPQNTRGFIQQIYNNPSVPDKAKKGLDGLYKTRNTKELSIRAQNFVKDYPNIARDVALNSTDDNAVAVAMELVKKHQATKEWDIANELSNRVAKNLTEAGRTSQAASIYGKLTPEGALRFANTELNKFNRLTGRNLGVEPDKAMAITEAAKKLQGMAEGYEKEVATKKLLKEIYTTIPPTLAEKTGTFQTMAQLLNPKAMIRNIGGNTMFSGAENVSQTVAAPIDKIVSLITGQRTTTLPNLKVQLKGAIKGGKQGARESMQGINLGPTSQFELNDIPTFRGKILGSLEKTMNVSLRAPDRAAYTAAFDDTIHGLLKLNKTDKVTPEMIEQAHHLGLYRTFQDKNVVSNFFVQTKKTLNGIGIGIKGKRFGLGDLILKYPKTPGNLVARGIDYSPAGFVKAVFEASQPLFGKPFNQKAFVDSFSRALVGSAGLVGTGAILGKLGIITEAPSKDKDVRGIQKVTGRGGYQINASALKRFVSSGLNQDSAKIQPNDTLVSYDWAQPMAIPLSMGAKIANKGGLKENADTLTETLSGGVETLAEQPLVRGIRDLVQGNKSMVDIVSDTGKGAPASFTPTLLNQVKQMTDNQSRNIYDPSATKEAINLVKNKVPGLSKTLPERVNVLGQPQETYQNGSNNLLNVFLNPAFVSKYKPNPETDTVMNLVDKTSETKHLPRVVSNTVKINGENRKLTGEEVAQYQKYVGTRTAEGINLLSKDDKFNSLDDTGKVNKISSLLTEVNKQAKIDLFGQEEKQKIAKETKPKKPKAAKKGKKAKKGKTVSIKTKKPKSLGKISIKTSKGGSTSYTPKKISLKFKSLKGLGGGTSGIRKPRAA